MPAIAHWRRPNRRNRSKKWVLEKQIEYVRCEKTRFCAGDERKTDKKTYFVSFYHTYTYLEALFSSVLRIEWCAMSTSRVD
jgi:hypothetical protein